MASAFHDRQSGALGVLKRPFMRSLELKPAERLLLESGGFNEHQWRRSTGKIFLTNERFLFQDYYFPFSLYPFRHKHQWDLNQISLAGKSRHAQTLFVWRTLFLVVDNQTHWFLVDHPDIWLAELTKLGIERG